MGCLLQLCSPLTRKIAALLVWFGLPFQQNKPLKHGGLREFDTDELIIRQRQPNPKRAIFTITFCLRFQFFILLDSSVKRAGVILHAMVHSLKIFSSTASTPPVLLVLVVIKRSESK